MQERKQESEFSFKSFFFPLTTLKAIHIIILVGFLVYGNMLFNGFVWDDIIFIIANPQVHQFNLATLFGPNLFNDAAYYRPLAAVYFAFLFTLFGQIAFLYHLFQLIFHILTTILVFLFIGKFINKQFALLLSLLFLVHPINVESVSYIASTGNILFVLFGLGSLLILFKKDQTTLHGILLCLFLLISLLIKETGGLFILLILLYCFFFKSEEIKRISFLLLSTTVVYLLIRFLIGQVYINKEEFVQVPILKLSFIERVMHIPQVLFYYIKTFFFPQILLIDQQWIITKFDFHTFYLPLILDLVFFASIILLGWYLYKKKKQIMKLYTFFCVWFVIGMGFHLQLFPLDMTVADRWFYFPFIGLLGLLGVASLSLQKHIRNWVIIFLIIVICFLSLRTMVRNTNWYNAKTLYYHDLRYQPENYDLQNNLGYALIQEGRLDLAKQHLQSSVMLAPEQSTNWTNLGVVYAMRGDYMSAEKYFRTAIKNDPLNLLAYQNVALLLLKEEKFTEAKYFLTDTVKKFPNSAGLYLFLAKAEYSLGDKKGALQTAHTAVELDPNIYHKNVYTAIKNDVAVPW